MFNINFKTNKTETFNAVYYNCIAFLNIFKKDNFKNRVLCECRLTSLQFRYNLSPINLYLFFITFQPRYQ